MFDPSIFLLHKHKFNFKASTCSGPVTKCIQMLQFTDSFNLGNQSGKLTINLIYILVH
jgi:hypothetical protein